MNRIIIDKKLPIKVHSKTLELPESKIPLRLVDLLILTQECAIDLHSLSKIAKAGVPILVVTTKPKEFIFMQKCTIKNGELKERQYRALEHRLAIAKDLLIQKLQKSQDFLTSRDRHFDADTYIVQAQKADSLQRLLGIEGIAAKSYFERYFSLFPRILTKRKRTRHPPLDPVNAMLSYIYTIFYYEIGSRLIMEGFEPAIGYLHTPFRDHMALASDILELFRARIDRFVYELFHDKVLLPKDFTKREGVYLTPKGRKKLWPDLKEFLQSQDPDITREIAKLRATIRNVSSSDHRLD